MNNPLPLRIDNKVIGVTGGYGYLGAAIVENLVYHGAHVIVLGKSKEKFEKKFANRENISFENIDISNTQSIISAFNRIIDTHQKLDVLINNGFYLRGQSPETLSDEEWSYSMDGVLGSVFRCTREIISIFKKQGYGNIINVSSMYGVVAPDFDIYENTPAFLNPPHYGAAKAGILQLTRYYAGYLGKWNIRVNAVTPGPYPSEEVQKNKEFVDQLSERTMVKSIGKPEEVAGAFTFLSSDAARYITGQNLVVDGGWTAK